MFLSNFDRLETVVVLLMPGHDRGRNFEVDERGFEGDVADQHEEICVPAFLHTHGAVVFEEVQAQICGEFATIAIHPLFQYI